MSCFKTCTSTKLTTQKLETSALVKHPLPPYPTHTHKHANTHRLQPPDACWQNCLRSLIGTFLFFLLFLTLSFCPSYSVFLSFSCACACVHFCSGAKACVSACFHGKRIRAWVPLNETEAEATAHSVAMR